MQRTRYRPVIDGFDFINNWDNDENYKAFARQLVKDKLPTVVGILAANPLSAAMFETASGALDALGLLVGLPPGTLTRAAAIAAFLGNLENIVAASLPDVYGACGGMAFASLDYFESDIVCMRARVEPPRRIGDVDVDVPRLDPLNQPVETLLRNYIYDRHRDSFESGGVMNKTLEWWALLNFVPSQFGGGAEALKLRSVAEWDVLRQHIGAGRPWPIAVIHDTKDPFQNHQVVAYGHDVDAATGDDILLIYDNRERNQERHIRFKLSGPVIEGTYTHRSGVRYDETTTIRGFFCANYVSKRPPDALAMATGLRVDPDRCVSVGDRISLSFSVDNLGPRDSIALAPVVQDGLDARSYPTDFDALENSKPIGRGGNRFVGAHAIMHGSGSHLFQARVFVREQDRGTLEIETAVRSVSASVPGTSARRQLDVHPQLFVVAARSINDDCAPWRVEGTTEEFVVSKSPFGGTGPFDYAWSVTPPVAQPSSSSVFTVTLPPAGTRIMLRLALTERETHCTIQGELEFETWTEEQGRHAQGLCELAHSLAHIRDLGSGIKLPQDGGDPIRPADAESLRDLGATAATIARAVEGVLRRS